MEKVGLIVDIGNSFIKHSLVRNGKLEERIVNTHEEATQALDSVLSSNSISGAIISSTASKEFTEHIQSHLNQNTPIHLLSHESKLPFTLAYETPETLGRDRIANVAGALKYAPGQNVLVIDLGTCITYDMCTSKAEFKGGAIAPGFKMRFKAMNDYSARLPRIEELGSPAFIGSSTDSSLRAGVYYGILGEIHLFILETEQSLGATQVFITGGDMKYFVGGIKKPIFANPKLTLEGLYELFKLNL